MDSGNLKRLIFLYWRHSQLDQENARTSALYHELLYNDRIRIPMRHGLEFVFANVNRRTESYMANRHVVEAFRRYKIRKEPLFILELWDYNEEGRKQEMISVDSEYRFRLALERIQRHLNPPREEYRPEPAPVVVRRQETDGGVGGVSVRPPVVVETAGTGVTSAPPGMTGLGIAAVLGLVLIVGVLVLAVVVLGL